MQLRSTCAAVDVCRGDTPDQETINRKDKHTSHCHVNKQTNKILLTFAAVVAVVVASPNLGLSQSNNHAQRFWAPMKMFGAVFTFSFSGEHKDQLAFDLE